MKSTRRETVKIWKNIQLELYKLFKKKTTYLILIPFLVPVIFGIGMYMNVSFVVSDGATEFDVISENMISAMEFINNMYLQANYITYLIIIIISSIMLSSEVENGQIRLLITRIGKRRNIILSKYFAMFMFISLFMFSFSLFSTIIYYLFTNNSSYGNGMIFPENWRIYGQSFLYSYFGLLVIVALTFFLGMKLKTFMCFASAYLIWFLAKYLEFFDNVQLLAPDNSAEFVLQQTLSLQKGVILILIFSCYILLLLWRSSKLMTKRDFS